MSIEAIKHYEAALKEAFPRGANGDVFEHWNKARIAIAEAEKQEPIGYLEIEDIEDQREYPHNCRAANLWYEGGEGLVAVYTHPQPKREWVGLTNEDKQELAAEQHGWEDLLIAAEVKLKEKNT
jgi:hypothetical protein